MNPFKKKKHKGRDSAGSTSSSHNNHNDIQADGAEENGASHKWRGAFTRSSYGTSIARSSDRISVGTESSVRISTGSWGSDGISITSNSSDELRNITILDHKTTINGEAKVTNRSSNDNHLESNLVKEIPENGGATARTANKSRKLSTVDCAKHPGHKEFIPVHDLQIQHLPLQYQRAEWVDFIKLKSKETVLIQVFYTSPDRPDDFGYPELKGKKDMRFGSGTAFIMNMNKNEECQCSEISGPHQISGFIKVMTVAHVVFDDEEAKNTVISFFYDDDKSTVVTARGERVSHIDMQRNRSVVECRTHDMSLYPQLFKARQERINLIEKSLALQVNHDPMVVLISHPHGLSKCVSIGKLLEMKEEGEIKTTKDGVELIDCILSYDTPTCPGAGGGSINLIGNGEVCYAFAPHCASHSNGRNISGLGWAKYVKSMQIRN